VAGPDQTSQRNMLVSLFPACCCGRVTRGRSPHTNKCGSSRSPVGFRGPARAVPEPHGFAFFNQEIFADDYRGQTVTFSGELRSTDVADHAGLALRVSSEGQRIRPQPAAPDPGYDPRRDPHNHFAAVSGSNDWTRREVTAQIPGDTAIVSFGVFLTGHGQIELRNAELERYPASQQHPGRSHNH
jgi:hypothetical protein